MFQGSAGVDEFVHGLLGFLVELGRSEPRHPLLSTLVAQLGQAASASTIAAAIHDLRALLQGARAGLDYVPGLLERSGALQRARDGAQPGVDAQRLALVLEAVEDARIGIDAAAELAGEALGLQRDCILATEPRTPRCPEPPARTGLHEVVHAAARLAGRRVDLRLALEAPAPVQVAAPRRDLLRVLVNLLRNASQAIDALEDPCDASITVATWASDELAFVQIADEGPGIPSACLDAIFELFFTTEGEGTGVGLFVCKALVTGWGGLIHVDSRPGEGARFTFSVPLAPPCWSAEPEPPLALGGRD